MRIPYDVRNTLLVALEFYADDVREIARLENTPADDPEHLAQLACIEDALALFEEDES